MKYEFFSSSRKLDEVICAYPALVKIKKSLKIRKTNFHTFHELSKLKIYRGISVTKELPEFMRTARMTGLHEPVVEEGDITFINLWPRQCRGMFGDFSLMGMMKMCNYHLAEFGCDIILDPNEFLPKYPSGILPSELKSCMMDADYPPIFFSPSATHVLNQKGFMFGNVFGSCSLGFYAVPDFIRAKQSNVYTYRNSNLNAAIMCEFASKFRIIIATASDTALLDLSNPSTIVYIVGDRTNLYHNLGHAEICYDLMPPNADHTILIRKLKSLRI